MELHSQFLLGGGHTCIANQHPSLSNPIFGGYHETDDLRMGFETVIGIYKDRNAAFLTKRSFARSKWFRDTPR